MPQDDREAIASFLDGLNHLMAEGLVRAQTAPWTNPDGVTVLMDLWSYQTRRIDRAYTMLRSPTPPEGLDDHLADHGLIGRELRIKIAIFQAATDDYWERSHSHTRFHRALTSADVTLGSVAAVPIPPLSALQGVSEAKEAIEAVFGGGRRVYHLLRRIRDLAGR
jgi:hypothetical protein